MAASSALQELQICSSFLRQGLSSWKVTHSVYSGACAVLGTLKYRPRYWKQHAKRISNKMRVATRYAHVHATECLAYWIIFLASDLRIQLLFIMEIINHCKYSRSAQDWRPKKLPGST